MDLVTSVREDLATPPVFALPTFKSFVIVLTGRVCARRRVITRTIAAADTVETKCHSAFLRVFSTARWSAEELGLAVFALVRRWLADDPVLWREAEAP